jgi:hypothetical protein
MAAVLPPRVNIYTHTCKSPSLHRRAIIIFCLSIKRYIHRMSVINSIFGTDEDAPEIASEYVPPPESTSDELDASRAVIVSDLFSFLLCMLACMPVRMSAFPFHVLDRVLPVLAE